MPRRSLFPPMLVLAALLLAGCQTGLPGAGPDPVAGDVTPNAVAGEAIEVTPLDAPPAPLDPAASAATPAPDAAPAQTDPPAAVEEAATPAPQPELEAEAPPVAKSERQVACEKRGGTWARGSSAAVHTCVFPTKDGGKQCTRESQCDGVCLARSGTCAPVKPLLGCNEILQDNGSRVTLCIE
jgi:predicted small secreted protein